MVARTGRRPGNPDTREAILVAARDAFADRGFDGASIRAIATAAGVDPALVHHYYGSKDQLFLESMRVPIDPGAAISAALGGGVDGAGERLVRMLLTIWDSPAGIGAAAVIRSAVSNETFARMLREFIARVIMRRIAKSLDLDPAEAPMRTGLVATQVAGLILTRYIVQVQPLASAPPEVLVGLIGPTVQRYLTAPLPDLT
ncbi:MAG TPA: TetR family transcriptional regulator [Micromonosporaceae bacterium]